MEYAILSRREEGRILPVFPAEQTGFSLKNRNLTEKAFIVICIRFHFENRPAFSLSDALRGVLFLTGTLLFIQ